MKILSINDIIKINEDIIKQAIDKNFEIELFLSLIAPLWRNMIIHIELNVIIAENVNNILSKIVLMISKWDNFIKEKSNI